MKETGPEEYPPFDNGSFDERSFDKFVPAPDPPLNIQPSSRYQSRIDCILSSTAKIKQALHCGRSCTPTLNQTGLLKAAYWFIKIHFKSREKFSASSTEVKYPSFNPHFAIISATLSIICFALYSLSGESRRPRKYLDATMSVAV